METDELLTRIHLRYFGGEKVLMLMEPAEKEEAFFFFENGLMVRQRGYYIYYEKNPLMQEYMIEKNKDFAPEFTENGFGSAIRLFPYTSEGAKKTSLLFPVPENILPGLPVFLPIFFQRNQYDLMQLPYLPPSKLPG